MNLEELRARLLVLNGEAQAVRKAAEDEKRDLSGQEGADLDRVMADFDRTRADIDRLEKLNSQTDLLLQGQGRRTQPDAPAHMLDDGAGGVQLARVPGGAAEVRGALSYVSAPANWNFKHLGDFAQAVTRACVKGGQLDRRLELSEKLAAASTYGNEGVGADGGFAVPPEFRNQIMVKILGEDSLLSRCDQVTCTGNTFTCPVDETTPWQTSGGILANWDGEAIAGTQSKVNLQERTIKLNKLRVLCPVTEEMLEDSPALNSYLSRKAPDKINFKVNAALVAGTGAGQPQGVIGATCKIQVAKESGQQANTIVAQNVIKMWNRLYADYRQTAVWLVNQETEPQLLKLSLPGTDNTGNFVSGWGGFIYTPANLLTQGKFATLFGRPVIPTQACSALSAEGDIILADFSQYLALLKSGPNPKTDVSMHLWFDQDITAYKFTLRMAGMPWLSAAISPLNGSNTYSSIVTLQAR